MLKKGFIVIFLLITELIYSQSVFTINGLIQNTENNKLNNALVLVYFDNKQVQTKTDSLGNFFVTIPKGKVIFEVDHIQHLRKKIEYLVSNNDTIVIILEKKSNLLNEVKILSDSKKKIKIGSANSLIFYPDQLTNIPSLSGSVDFVKILQLTPGVQNSGDANGYLYIRGGDPGHNLMLYENTPIYGMSHLLGIFPFFNSNHIQDFSFDKSNKNPKYGGRLGSTINLNTFSKSPEKVAIKGNLGFLSSELSIAAPLSSKTGFYVSGRKTYIDEIIAPILNNRNENNQDLKYGFADGNFTFISKPTEKKIFKLDAFLSSDKFNIIDDSLSLVGNLKWGNLSIIPSYKVNFDNDKIFTSTFFYTKYSNNLNLEQSNIKMNVSSYIEDLGFLNSIQYKFKNIIFDSGFQFINHKLEPQKINIVNLGIENSIRKSEMFFANELAIYTNSSSKLSNRINLDFGLRINYYKTSESSSSRFNLEPRLVFYYNSSKNASYYASYTIQNQYLNLITTSSVGIPTDFWIATSDGIPSQTSNEISFGYNQYFQKKISISTNIFYRNMQRLLEYPFGLTQFNQTTSLKADLLEGKGDASGIEIMIKKETGKFKGWLSYTLSYANRQFNGLNNGNSFYAKYDRRHNFSITTTYDFNSRWNFATTQIISSGNRFTIPTSWYFFNNSPVKEYSNYNNAQIPDYFRTDFSIQYWFFKKNKRESGISLSVYNTFAIKNPIYINLKVNKSEEDKVLVSSNQQVLYTILPSINWLFKF